MGTLQGKLSSLPAVAVSLDVPLALSRTQGRTMSDVLIRAATEADVPAMAELRERSGWQGGASATSRIATATDELGRSEMEGRRSPTASKMA